MHSAQKCPMSPENDACCFYDLCIVFSLLSYLPLCRWGHYPISRYRILADSLSKHSDLTFGTGCDCAVSGYYNTLSRTENAGQAPPGNCPVDVASVVVCVYYRCSGLFDAVCLVLRVRLFSIPEGEILVSVFTV